MLLIYYPKCSTCKKAEQYLINNNITFNTRDIKLNKPSMDEIIKWHKQSGLPLKRFFNTSGILYRELKLKDKLATMSEEEQYKLLASDGMLVKRPILITDSTILLGYKETEWNSIK